MTLEEATPEVIAQLREELIACRNEAMNNTTTQFNSKRVVLLSHLIQFLYAYVEHHYGKEAADALRP